MKKRFIGFLSAALLILLMLLPFSANAQSKYVIDNADLMSDSQEEELAKILEDFAAKYNFDAVALTVNTLDGKTPMAYADDYYDYNDYKEDGCLFLISMEDRDWWISTKGFGITAITDYGIDVIESEVVPYLSDGDYYGGYKTYAKIVEDFVSQAKSGSAYDTNNEYTNDSGYTYSNSYDYSDEDDGDVAMGALIISFIVAIIIAAVVVSMVKHSYKPVRFKASAQDYLVAGSLNVTGSYENFLYSNVTKTEIQTESSHGGGSSTHSSSSGSSHGGGGGKF